MSKIKHIYDTKNKLSEILDSDPLTLNVISRLGIKLGFGEATVSEVCAKYGLDAETFCLICNVYSDEGYKPTAELLSKGHITDVVKYLKESHRQYLTKELKSLESAIEVLISPCQEKTQKVIWRFFREYKEELQKHFEYEEDQVFPYIRDLMFGRESRTRLLGGFEETHDSIGGKLSDLKNLVMKTLPEECDDALRTDLLHKLYFLQRDLACHTMIEDGLLMPMLHYMERPTSFVQVNESAEGRDKLSAREKEILVCVASGMINKEIADRYNISVHTVITHRKNITRKTGIKTVAGLTVYALLNGLIDTNTVE